MKRKIYTTAHERKIDQLIGFVAFPLVNIPLLAAYLLLPWAADTLHVPIQAAQVFQVCISLLPWIVNGLVLVLAFLFCPHIGIGYLAFMGMTGCALAALSILFLTACFGIMGAMWAASINNSLGRLLAYGVAYVLPLGTLCLFSLGAFAFIIWWLRHK